MFQSSSADTRISLLQVLDLGTLSGLTEGQLLDRYLACRDERAFEMIVTRHAGMVLGVCRRMLIDPNDVDDAFQATFLILIRKASSIRSRDRLSPWLYGVAYKVASRARALSKARRARERANPLLDVPDRPRADPGSDLFPVFDEELTRLPEKYRAPLRLCCLEGKSHDEAAAELAWPVGTVRSRLFRGRRILQTRLTRRGVAPTLVEGGSLTSLLRPTVPPEPSLIDHTLQTASRFGNAKVVATSTVSSSVAILTRGVLTTMFLTKLKVIAGSLLLLSAVGSGAVIFAQNSKPRPSGGHTGGPLATNSHDPSARRDLADLKGLPADPGGTVSSHELRARLNVALRKLEERTNHPGSDGAEGEGMQQARGEVEILKAQIEDERETIANAIELLKIRLHRMEQEIEGLNNLLSSSRKVLARSKDLFARNAIGQTAMIEPESDVANSETQVALKQIDILEMKTRIKQLNRRLKLFEPVEVGNASPTPKEPSAPDPSQPRPK